MAVSLYQYGYMDRILVISEFEQELVGESEVCVISKWTWPICFCVDMYDKEVDGGRLI
jgi:hypothetical protein